MEQSYELSHPFLGTSIPSTFRLPPHKQQRQVRRQTRRTFHAFHESFGLPALHGGDLPLGLHTVRAFTRPCRLPVVPVGRLVDHPGAVAEEWVEGGTEGGFVASWFLVVEIEDGDGSRASGGFLEFLLFRDKTGFKA